MSSDVVSQPVRDPYGVLGLDRHASEAEIKRAYFQLVRHFPPEREPEKFRDIRTAYEQLRDAESRARIALFLVHPPETQVQAPSEAENTPMTHQVQQRLLHLDVQIAHMQAQVECLMADTTEA